MNRDYILNKRCVCCGGMEELPNWELLDLSLLNIQMVLAYKKSILTNQDSIKVCRLCWTKVWTENSLASLATIYGKILSDGLYGRIVTEFLL